MSHISIIISRKAATSTTEALTEQAAPTYTYEIPIAHDWTPQQVGEVVRKAYKRLESADD